MAKILILDDDIRLIDTVTVGLTANGHVVETSSDGNDALYRLKYLGFDLAILDWSVPGMTGVQVCREYRAHGGRAPILMLTGKNDISDKEAAFEIGADDYLTKPFAFRELMARIRALLRRPPVIESEELAVGPAKMHLTDRNFTVNGQRLDLAPAEFSLLEVFMRAPTKTFTSDELFNKLYSSETDASGEAMRQRLFRLRKALKGTTIGIETVSSSGYRLQISE
jgi:DNA-binding response OmpR family regulator